MRVYISIIYLIIIGFVFQACSSNENIKCEAVAYRDTLSSFIGSNSHFEINEAIACAKANSRPILIHFTGHGADRSMESELIKSKSNRKKITRDFTFLTLYIDEKLRVRPEYWVVGDNGDTLKRMDLINGHLQATKFNTSGYPFFVIVYPSIEPVIEPFSNHIDKELFEDFLNSGLDEYYKNCPRKK